jgi:hypothetical protein
MVIIHSKVHHFWVHVHELCQIDCLIQKKRKIVEHDSIAKIAKNKKNNPTKLSFILLYFRPYWPRINLRCSYEFQKKKFAHIGCAWFSGTKFLQFNLEFTGLTSGQKEAQILLFANRTPIRYITYPTRSMEWNNIKNRFT